jgi:drug/metabolite transporter (DMT)-like permease
MPRTKRSPRTLLGIAAALLATYLIWGSAYLGVGIALRSFPPFRLTGLRFLLAGGVLYLVVRWRGAPGLTRAQWMRAAAVGALLMLGGLGALAFAQQWIASGLAAVGVATIPLWAALFAGLWGRWPRRLEWAGLCVGFAGVCVLGLDGALRTNPVAALALLVSAASWALGSVWSQHLELPAGLVTSAAEMLTGGALLLVVSVLAGERMRGPVTPESLGVLAYLVVGGSVVAFGAYAYLLDRARPTLATSYAYVTPAIAVAIGAWLAKEQLAPAALAALPVILIGDALLAVGGRQGTVRRQRNASDTAHLPQTVSSGSGPIS